MWVTLPRTPRRAMLLTYTIQVVIFTVATPWITTTTTNIFKHQTTTALLSVFYDLNGLSNRIRRRGVRTKGKTATRIDKMLIFLLVFAAYVYVFKYR